MLNSKPTEYAVRALTYLARQPPGELTRLKDVAAAEDIPVPYLGKIMQTLVKGGLLRSTKGPRGGFALIPAPEDVTLWEIRRVLQGVGDLASCPVGLEPCNEDTPCPIHDAWQLLRVEIESFMRGSSLDRMLEEVNVKQAALDAPAE